MSLVGAGGRGESVWLGWFLVSLLRPFADVAEARGEADRAARLPRARRDADRRARRRVGRRMVPPRVLRRRDAARIEGEHRVPDRRDRAVVGGDLRRRRSGARAAGDGVDRSPPRPREGRHHPAADAAVRQDDAESGLHPGLRARRARERRAVHPRGAVDDPGVRAARRRRPRRGALPDAESHQPRAPMRRASSATASSPTSSRPTSIHRTVTSGAAAGRGTRGRPAGCTGSASRRFWESRCTAARCASIPAFRAGGRTTR